MYEQVGQRLRQEAAKRPQLAGTIDLYCALLKVQARARIPPSVLPEAQEALARQEQGLPLLSPEALALEGPALAEMCDQIVSVIAAHRPELAGPLAAARKWLNRRRHRLDVLALDYLREGRIDGGHQTDLLASIFETALRPFLRALAQSLAPFVTDDAWYRGVCPVCGARPDFATLGQPGGRRRLLCSRCDTEWTFHRIGCPFCGNDDPHRLGHYPSDDGAYRLSVCEACRRYIKTVDLRETGHRLPAVERVLTVGMDLAAEKAGYQRD